MSPALPRRPSAELGDLTLCTAYRVHADFVARVVKQLGAPEEAVEDLVHDVFLVVARRLPDYDRTRSLRAWLFGISRNVVHNHVRRTGRRARRNREAVTPLVSPGTDDELLRQQAAAHVDRFLSDLDPQMRLVFVMCEIEEMSAPEIADALDLNCNTVYSRIRRIRRRFDAYVAQLSKDVHDRP